MTPSFPHAAFRRKLLCWYTRHARSLPWRDVADPYFVWVSEIMLQQTTTQTVQGYFDRFIQAFPTIPSLAAADLETVNRLWEGLGYYRRCASMHQAAKEIVARFGGVFPDRYQDVLRLPGIGRYTAGAILSIAFDQRLPILEANTFRLHARLLAIRGDLMRGEANERLWKFAEEILPRSGSGKLNQALMDVGSLLCTPKSPKCTECPVALFCESAKQGLQADIPSPKTKEPPEYRTEVALLLRKRGKTFLIRYPEGQRWAGLWDFPRAETDAELPLAEDMGLRKRLAELTGRKLIPGRFICSLKHSVTKYRITLLFCEGIDAGLSEGKKLCETRWATAAELQELPMNSTARTLVLNQVNPSGSGHSATPKKGVALLPLVE
jgi:A/G-specific adenine glycosylase